MHIEWDEIQTIEALVRTGSVEAAGRELTLRHSTVSRRIAALEVRHGAALFVRGARLVPTPLAVAIAAKAGAMRTQATEIDGLFTLAQRARQQRVTITTSDVLAPLLFLALSTVPRTLSVEVIVSDRELELSPGQVDLALRPKHEPSSTLRGRRLGRLRIGLYTPRGGSEGWILPSDSLRARASMRWWREVPKSAPRAITCDSLLAIRDACCAGLGRAAFPSFLAHAEPRLRLERELEGGPPLWLLAPAARETAKELQDTQRALFAALRGIEGAFVGLRQGPVNVSMRGP